MKLSSFDEAVVEAVLAVLGSGIHVPWKGISTEGVRGRVATPPRG
jgi:hypothetical protein